MDSPIENQLEEWAPETIKTGFVGIILMLCGIVSHLEWETWFPAKTLCEFGQSLSTKHLFFSLSQRLRKFFDYFEVLLLNSLIYSSEGLEWLQRLP